MNDLIYAVGDLIEAEIPGGVTVIGRIVEVHPNEVDGYVVESVSPGDDGHRYRVHQEEIKTVLDS